MSVTPSVVIAAYVLPLLLLALLLARSRLRQWQKVLLLAAMPVFYILQYQGLTRLSGWPTEQPVPERFRLLGQQVTQPDKRNGDPGNIRLWLQVDGDEQSRLYQLPYSRELHQRLVAAAMRAAQGRQQIGTRRPGNAADRGVSGSHDERVEFNDLPRILPPAKPGNETSAAN